MCVQPRRTRLARARRRRARSRALLNHRGRYTIGVSVELSCTTKLLGRPPMVRSRGLQRPIDAARRHSGAGFTHITGNRRANLVRTWLREFQRAPHVSTDKEIMPMRGSLPPPANDAD